MPTVALFSDLGFGVLQYIDEVVDVPEDAVWLLYGGLWKNFTYFLHVPRAVRLESGRYFSGSHLPLWLRQSTETLDAFLLFST